MATVARRVLLAILVIGALACASSAFAVGHLVLTGHSWVVGIADGPGVTVAADGTYKDCTSKPIADLALHITFSDAPKGKPYSFRMIGPPIAGKTVWTLEGDFNLTKGQIEPTYLTLGFPALKRDQVSDFPPGTYRFELRVGQKVKLSQTITIVKEAGC